MITTAAQPEVRHPEIYVISSVQPTPTGGGETVLHRHLSQLDRWQVFVTPTPENAETPGRLSQLTHRLRQTRLSRWVQDFDVLQNGQSWDRLLPQYTHSSSPAIVLTVAHGDGCWAAQRFAKYHSLPLVTLFHDWYPDIPSVHAFAQKTLERRFIQLYQQSDLALCVSQPIQTLLGSHPNSLVLYPIPEPHLHSGSENSSPAHSSTPLKVRYFGNLYDYGPMLAALLETVKDHASVEVQIRGANPNWPEDFSTEMRDRNLWLDFVPWKQLTSWLSTTDVFLVTMSFDPLLRRRMQTSFPSKLLEYTQFGKPIVIWGPEYCSAVQWAKQCDGAVCVTSENALDVVQALEEFSQSPDRRTYYAKQAQSAAHIDFNPTHLQNLFVNAISQLI
jgi:glycosyltransferase involved in cell wall biosynthesis